jgi:hypothetical protein
MSGLSKEELRAARLRAMEKAATPESSASQHTQAISPVNRTLDLSDCYDQLMEVIYHGGEANEEDLLRWNYDGFHFCVDPPFGLKQGHGGPCGILAVVQAELIARLFFTNSLEAKCVDICADVANVNVRQALVEALTTVLIRAGKVERTIVVTFTEGSENAEIPLLYWNRQEIKAVILQGRELVRDHIESNMAFFEQPGGCLLFLISLVLTRCVAFSNNTCTPHFSF